MKLQLTEQAVRLRLSEAEIAQFIRVGVLAHTLAVGAGPHLRYALIRLPEDDPAVGLRLRYAADTLTVEVPAALARPLAEGGNISLKGEVVEAGRQPLRILVERDLGPSH